MKPFILLLALWFPLELVSSAMTVEEAYRAIPHRYTSFDTKVSKIPANEVSCLERLFRLINLAIVERVQTLAWFESKGKRGSPFENYQKRMNDLLIQFSNLPVATSLGDVRRLVVEAIQDQRIYFEEWKLATANRETFRYAWGTGLRHPRLLASSQKLQQAYAGLMRLYSQEETHNQQAFFDHLCALDFL